MPAAVCAFASSSLQVGKGGEEIREIICMQAQGLAGSESLAMAIHL